MSNRTTAIIITILAVLLCGCPGIAFLCFGVTDFIDYYALNSYIYGITDKTASDIWGVIGLCAGMLFIVITIVVAIVVLRKKKENLPTTDEPIPPAA
jgi:phosphotransferase system  glucose/maltose/N-acetylglucosamine-specific IIC component